MISIFLKGKKEGNHKYEWFSYRPWHKCLLKWSSIHYVKMELMSQVVTRDWNHFFAMNIFVVITNIVMGYSKTEINGKIYIIKIYIFNFLRHHFETYNMTQWLNDSELKTTFCQILSIRTNWRRSIYTCYTVLTVHQ